MKQMSVTCEYKVAYFDEGVLSAMSEPTFGYLEEAKAYAEQDSCKLEKKIVRREVTEWNIC